MSEHDVVLFLGAGFSRPAGLPVMSEFWTGSLVDLGNLRNHRKAKNRNAAPMLVEAAETLSKFRALCDKTNSIPKKDLSNIETLYCLAEAMRVTGVEFVNLDGKDVSIDDLIENIQFWIWKVYQQGPWFSPSQLNKRNGTEGVNEKFIEQLLTEHGVNNRITIITTNYDLVVEHMAWSQGIKCSYPLSNENATSFNICCDGQPYVYLSRLVNGNQTLPICKLHGSVNFFKRIGMHPNLMHVAVDVGDNQSSVGKSTRQACSDRATLFWVDAIWELRQKYPQALPVFVPPSFIKFVDQGWLKETWQYAFDALVRCKAILFVGYSLPETDAYIRAVLQAVLTQRGEAGHPQVIVIDPCKTTKDRYLTIFPNTDFRCKRLEDIVGSELSEIFVRMAR